MSNVSREIAQFIESIDDQEVLIYFGAGEIGARTAKKFGQPSWSVDNSPSLWGGSYGSLKDIRSPASLKSFADRAKVIICSAAELEIRHQLSKIGVPEQNIVMSPYARSIAPAQKLYDLKLNVLVASGGPSSDKENSGGGLYLVSIDGDFVAQRKLFGASAHGLVALANGSIIASTDEGLIKVNLEDDTVSSFSKLPDGLRPHGIAYNEAKGELVVVGNSSDSLVSLSEEGEISQITPVLRGSRMLGIALHHMNDVAYSNGALYLSMFSFTGSWKSGVYDGGIYAFDASTLEPLGPVVSGATMPHSVTFRDGELWFCNSLPGTLTKGDREFELVFPTFARGLDFESNLAVVGASRNRNFRDNLLESGTSIREVNSGIFATLMDSGLSRFIPLHGLVPEIHALKLVNNNALS